jgi:hypothetical protein
MQKSLADKALVPAKMPGVTGRKTKAIQLVNIVDTSYMNDLELESARSANILSRVPAASSLKERLIGELRELTRQNREITAQLRAVRQIERNLSNRGDVHKGLTANAERLTRACRIALLESDVPQTVQQIYARIQRRNSFHFTTPERAMRTIGRTLAEIAARGEIRCNAGAWERNIAPGAGVEISNFEIVVAMGAFESR